MTAPARPVLTDTELAVLRGAAEGLTYAVIGRRLGLNEKSVSKIAVRVIRKLGARNITHAVHIGHSVGLLWRDCLGDRASYLRHLYRGEPTHAACRAANARHNAEQRARQAQEGLSAPASRPRSASTDSGPSGLESASEAHGPASRPTNQTKAA